MTNALKFRANSLSSITNKIGCYILSDLDNVPLYVGQSKDGIRARVQRHLTSARSDIIANRQIDVWEIAFVWSYPVQKKSNIAQLEADLIHYYDHSSQLINGKLPTLPPSGNKIISPVAITQVISNDDLKERLSPEARLPRQAQHYANLVDHFLVVKQSEQIARSMQAHFDRLQRYHADLLKL